VRRAFVRELAEIAERDPRILLITGDLGFSVVEPFADRHPDRFFNAGIAEQNMLGLATGLGIDRKEAEEYIRAYFELYAGVKKWIQETIAEVRKTGYAPTLHGRKRPIPDLHSRNPNARGFAERTAVNTPLQGTAADLIKIAMIRIQHAIEEKRMKTRMILQVHDELVFEVPVEELERAKALVTRLMEGVYALDVPIKVEVKVGRNWYEAEPME